ncbi:MAG TPA: GNAT family N-acetyltransferase [Thermomicrobiales bacterium]|nr:GNAT family N-acetyltransferase [Thermomicrobiales bacterium]
MAGGGRERQEPAGAGVEIREIDAHGPAFADVIAIRRTVFTDEQALTDTVDRDPYDYGGGAAVVLALLDGRPVGTGRLHVWRGFGQIAWVAVLAPERGLGIGWEIMVALLGAAERLGARRVTLSAQTHAIGFYEKLGFHTVGGTFIMGNIEHITMERDLGD